MQSQGLKAARRTFLKRTAGGMVSASTLSLLASHAALADDHEGRRRGRGYGPLARKPDQRGVEVLALPEGFRYVTFSRTGEGLMDGSGLVPRNHDGMACFPGRHGSIRLIRNHENRNVPGDATLGVPHAGTPYDAQAFGGTVTIDFDPDRMQPVREFVSICGTTVNCAGGLAYRDAGWLTCEETIAGPNTVFQATTERFAQPHGYTFLVPAKSNGPTLPVALKDLGRFAKEAAVADERSGIVYQTEDAGNNSGFYRFIPRDADDLERGGKLQMLKVSGQPGFNGFVGQTVGEALRVEWVDIDDPDPSLAAGAPSCFAQGRAQGGAAFNRLEGVYRSDPDGRDEGRNDDDDNDEGGKRGHRRSPGGSIFFISTSGGQAQRGQLWHYKPAGRDKGLLTLEFESPDGSVLDSPDNMCVTPSGAVLFCEDDASPADTHPLAPGITDVNRLIGLSRDGVPFEFAVNVLNDSEFAGACFSPDGDILFVNVFGGGAPLSGMTCAITGPWRKGPL